MNLTQALRLSEKIQNLASKVPPEIRSQSPSIKRLTVHLESAYEMIEQAEQALDTTSDNEVQQLLETSIEMLDTICETLEAAIGQL